MDTKIADRVNIEDIEYQRVVKRHVDKTVVRFAPSAGTLFFNSKMVNVLEMANWKQVVVGYDKKSKIIVLKKCDVEEYGAVLVRQVKKDAKRQRGDECRIITIRHMLRAFELTSTTRYKAESNGAMIFLEAQNNSV